MKLLTAIAAAVLALSISAPVKAEQIPQVPSPIIVLPTHVKSVNMFSEWISENQSEKSKCWRAARAYASAVYYRDRYESETVMYYARDLKTKICKLDDEAFFVLAQNEHQKLSDAARSYQVFTAEQMVEHYKANNISIFR